MRTRWILTNLALSGMAAAWLIPFVTILLHGTHTVHEPCLPVLILEIVFFAAIATLGFINLAKIPP